MELNGKDHFEFGEFRLEPDDAILFRDGEQVVLPPKMFELLLLFVQSGGRVISREEIMQRLWPDTNVEAANLKQIIYTLRKTLGDSSEENPIIKTLPKRGYRLVTPVRFIRSSAGDELSYTNVRIEEELIEIDDDHDAIDGTPAVLQLPPAKTVRSRLGLLMSIAGVVLIIGVVVYYFGFSRRQPPLSSENITLQKLTNTDNLYWAMLSPNGQFVAYILLHRDGRQSLHLLDIATKSERMLVEPDNVAYYGGAFTPDSSQLYYDTWRTTDTSGTCVLYQVPVLGDAPRKVLENVAGPVSFSPDGKRFVFTRGDRLNGATHMVSANAADGSDEKIIATTSSEYDFIAPNYSPDGTRVLFVGSEKRDDGLWWYIGEVPSGGGERRKITEPLKQRFWGATWFADGSTILLNSAAPDTKIGQLFTVDYATGEITRLTNDLNYYLGLSTSADGKKIVVTQGQRYDDVWTWSTDGSSPARRITDRSVTIDSLTWTADERILYNESENGRQTMWSITSDGQSRSRLTAGEIQLFYPDVSVDGNYVVARSNRSGSWQIWRMRSDGTEMQQLTPDSSITGRGEFALGGTKIVYERRVNDMTVLSMIDVDGGEPINISPFFIDHWTVSSDGNMLAYTFFDQSVKRSRTAIYSLERQGVVGYMEVLPRDFMLFSPDNRSILTKRTEGENDPISTIWEFPLDGSAPKKYFSNPPDNIYWAAFSRDGKKLSVVQGHTITNLVLFTRSD